MSGSLVQTADSSFSGNVLAPDIVGRVRDAQEKVRKVKQTLNRILKGQEDLIDKVVAGAVAGGHILLFGKQGGGKTTLAENLAKGLGLETNRIQCTPDLLPLAVLGHEVEITGADGQRRVEFVPDGPLFTQLLHVDEINRASPKLQAVFFQAMQEGFVTYNGRRYDVPMPFMMIATMNDEGPGTNPLPPPQLDRFMISLEVGQVDTEPHREIANKMSSSTDEEVRILYAALDAGRGKDLTDRVKLSEMYQEMAKVRGEGAEAENADFKPILGVGELVAMRKLAALLPIADPLQDAIIQMVEHARPDNPQAPLSIKEAVREGSGPYGLRPASSWFIVAKAHALCREQFAVDMSDVTEFVEPVLQHRLEVKSRKTVNKTGFSASMPLLSWKASERNFE